MRLFKSTSILLFAGLFFTLMSCGGDAAEAEGKGGEDGAAEEKIMTTAEFIEEAKGMTYAEFTEKYPRDTEIELKGKVMAPATWQDKITAKFGIGLNDLPLSADFMFEANGGSKDAAKGKIKSGEELHFKGKVGGAFYMDDTFKRCSFHDCVAQ